MGKGETLSAVVNLNSLYLCMVLGKVIHKDLANTVVVEVAPKDSCSAQALSQYMPKPSQW